MSKLAVFLVSALTCLSGCKQKPGHHNEPSQHDHVGEDEEEEQVEKETPEYLSSLVLLRWSRVDYLETCGEKPAGDPYCNEAEHTIWEPAEGTGYFNEEPHVYSRIRKIWNLDDTLWLYLIETKPAEYHCPRCAPLHAVAYVKPGAFEVEGIAKMGLKGSYGLGPDSVALVKDGLGNPYLRSTWTTDEGGVRDSLIEYQSLLMISETIRMTLSGNNLAACDSLNIPCYSYTYKPAGENGVLADTLRFHGEGTRPDAGGELKAIGDTLVVAIERSTGEKLACPDYLSADSKRVEGARLYGVLGAQVKMLIGGGLVKRQPTDSINPTFDHFSLKSGDLYPFGTIKSGFFAAGQHDGMNLECGYWWKEGGRRKSGNYQDSSWLVTYLIPLPDNRDVDCSFIQRFSAAPETAYCLLE
ncbi:MAG TPA: hypothetical protein VK465_15385 [Fibrobacteria bacterium]|nr:hypothetical protein [Fibrobacteria bacterium]